MRATVLAVLFVLFAGSMWASCTGCGIGRLGVPQLRAGSTGGPRVVGGGPGSGK
ncbi:MAG TPA: hypothetical protein VK610_06660 [Rhodothermales bacterium]|nr:hypothetical protein [Rhodothermales bacterium]